MPRFKSKDAERGENILAGATPAAGELERLAKELQSQQVFWIARRLLERRFGDSDIQASPDKKLKIGRRLAVITYKDPDLPLDERLDKALRLLNQVGSLDSTVDQETLGIAGAVHKRLWETYARKEDLERSLAFYKRGTEQGAARDDGYTGINAAYVLDLLAALEAGDTDRGTPIPRAAQLQLEQACDIRKDIIAKVALPKAPTTDDWWKLVTVAEAFIGLGAFKKAAPILKMAAELPDVPPWQKESTTRQVAALTRLRQQLPAPGQGAIKEAWDALACLVGGNTSAVESAFSGRIGLALSGGGFRASLFHIGVLARLAELDLLRGLEVLSCVSGGSIIGAHYYLHVRKLLRTKADAAITAADYVAIVEKIADEFLAGVQRNIRTRVAAEWTTNLKMILFPNYSRTLRVGELYERELFARVQDGEATGERWLGELTVEPPGELPNFNPKTDNWRRRAKVPMLVLNATTLNTGHNWQFTASWMGEPPGGINTQIDANYRLRRVYHDEAPKPHCKTRLGYAVAASSCVPGLFEPLPLNELYPDRTVRLVDGGVQDNQGIGALLDQDCNVILVSDASGQMDAIDDPSTGLLSVPLRSNSIAMARVREAQFRDVAMRRRSGLLRGLVFLHLKKDLEGEDIDWIGCRIKSPAPARNTLTGYGVHKEVQRQLSAIRTDLDSFSDTEAYALMTSGYLMTKEALQEPEAVGFPATQPISGTWKFLAAQPQMGAAIPESGFMNRLKIAEFIAFKVWRQSRRLQFAAFAVAFVVIALLIFQAGHLYSLPLPQLTLGRLLIIVAAAALLPLVASAFLRRIRLPKTVQQIAIGIGMATLGFIVARLHLHVFDKIFLKLGQMKS
jgi:predicted acylesterase/phospholipase RssA